MIETLVLSLALACPVPEPALPVPVVQALLGVYRETDLDFVAPVDHPLALVFGTERPELPVRPVTETGDELTYGVWADPVYDGACFEAFVDALMADPRAWPGIRKADTGEIPQLWVTLAAPAAACGSYENPRASCAWNNRDGTGIVTVNAMRWSRGYGYDLASDRITVVNHEVGHLLGFGHYECSLMATSPWQPGAGFPSFESEWDDCGRVPAWPSEEEQEISQLVYTERWLWGGVGPWDGQEFVDEYLAG